MWCLKKVFFAAIYKKCRWTLLLNGRWAQGRLTEGFAVSLWAPTPSGGRVVFLQDWAVERGLPHPALVFCFLVTSCFVFFFFFFLPDPDPSDSLDTLFPSTTTTLEWFSQHKSYQALFSECFWLTSCWLTTSLRLYFWFRKNYVRLCQCHII